MAEETVAQFLGRRERELIAQIAALRGQLAPKEAELAHVQHMRSFLPGGANVPPTDANSQVAQKVRATRSALRHETVPSALASVIPKGQSITEIVHESYKNKTIKELTIQALIDHFPHGAVIGAIHNFIREAYGRHLELASLRTQMHRLKADAVLEYNPGTEIWNLDQRKRQLYTMYDHPTSRAGMRELQDEPPQQDNPDDNALLRAAEKLAWRDIPPAPEEIAAAERLEELRMHRYATSHEVTSSTSNNEIIHDGGKLKLNP